MLLKVPVDTRGADQLEVMPPASLTRKIEAHLQIAGGTLHPDLTGVSYSITLYYILNIHQINQKESKRVTSPAHSIPILQRR